MSKKHYPKLNFNDIKARLFKQLDNLNVGKTFQNHHINVTCLLCPEAFILEIELYKAELFKIDI